MADDLCMEFMVKCFAKTNTPLGANEFVAHLMTVIEKLREEKWERAIKLWSSNKSNQENLDGVEKRKKEWDEETLEMILGENE